MTKHVESFQNLNAAIEAMKSQANPEGPSNDLLASTVEAMQKSSNSPVRPHPASHELSNDDSSALSGQRTRREMMLRFARYGTLGSAASIAIVLIGSLIINHATLQPAFGQVLENIRKATAVSYRMTQKIGKQPEMKFDCLISGPKMRMESPGLQIILTDTTTRDSLLLILPQKFAVKGKMQGDPAAKALNLAEVLAEITDEHAELVQQEMHDGKQVDVYDVDRLPSFLGQGAIGEDDTFRIWVDHETQLPKRVTIKLSAVGPERNSAEMEMTGFDWNPKIPPGAIEMVVPDGFEVKDIGELNAGN